MFRSVMNSHIIHLVLLLFATLKTTESVTVAWLFSSERQFVTEFNPVTKTLTPTQQVTLYPDLIKGVSAQNDDNGVYIYPNGVHLFNKTDKQFVFLNDNNYDDWDNFNIGISGANVILLSRPANGVCQSVTVLSGRSKDVIASNIAMKACREKTYCMGSSRNGDVYIFGGMSINGPGLLASEKYSAVTKSMEAIADLPSYMTSNFSACLTSEYDGNIMVCDNLRHERQNCSLYHPGENTWETVGSFVIDRDVYKLVAIENDLFAIGGIGVNSIEKYNKETKAWEVFMTDLEDGDVANYFYAFSI